MPAKSYSPLRLYLDTNTLLDLWTGRNPDTDELLVIAATERWELATSHFAAMEVIDVIQERKWAIRELGENNRQLNWVLRQRRSRKLPEDTLKATSREFTEFKRRFRRIAWYDVESGLLERAMGISLESNISAPDCLHVAMAVEIGAHILVTRDQPLLNQASPWIPTGRPEEITKQFEKDGLDGVLNLLERTEAEQITSSSP